ncbi:MAG: Holliday junction resolvase RuvX [Christensenellales bacterium]
MKIAGLDVGQARIGIAISDEMEILASSVESYHCKGDIETDARAVSEKLIELGAQKIVIGLPKNMNGTEGPAAEKCRAFGEMIGKFLDIEQVYSDERLTTVQAQRTLIGANVSRKKRKNVVDKLAAQLILQNYLDAQGVMR